MYGASTDLDNSQNSLSTVQALLRMLGAPQTNSSGQIQANPSAEIPIAASGVEQHGENQNQQESSPLDETLAQLQTNQAARRVGTTSPGGSSSTSRTGAFPSLQKSDFEFEGGKHWVPPKPQDTTGFAEKYPELVKFGENISSWPDSTALVPHSVSAMKNGKTMTRNDIIRTDHFGHEELNQDEGLNDDQIRKISQAVALQDSIHRAGLGLPPREAPAPYLSAPVAPKLDKGRPDKTTVYRGEEPVNARVGGAGSGQPKVNLWAGSFSVPKYDANGQLNLTGAGTQDLTPALSSLNQKINDPKTSAVDRAAAMKAKSDLGNQLWKIPLVGKLARDMWNTHLKGVGGDTNKLTGAARLKFEKSIDDVVNRADEAAINNPNGFDPKYKISNTDIADGWHAMRQYWLSR